MDKGWTKKINRLLLKLRKFETVDRHQGSDRFSVHTDENVDTVESLLLSQEDKRQSHWTVREISREAGDPSVVSFVDYSQTSVSRVLHVFTDEKVFMCFAIHLADRSSVCQEAWSHCWMASVLSANFFQVADGFNCRLKAGLFGAADTEFISPYLWPLNSPDLNPVDYRIRVLIQERVYRTPVRDVSQLKQRVTLLFG